MLPLMLAMLGAIAPALASQRRPLNISITDNSPLLWYDPDVPRPEENTTRTGAPTDSWNVTWSSTPWSLWTPNRVGHGTSAHATKAVGASVTFSWMGTGVTFLGHLDGQSAAVELQLLESFSAQEGEVHYPGDGRLASLHGLSWGWHQVRLILKAGTVSVTGLEYSTEIETQQ